MVAMTASLEDLKEKLPIAYVMEQYGYLPDSATGDRLHYVNPWRDDDRPSLDVFINDKGIQRYGDYATGEQGSVIDIITMATGDGSLVHTMNTARRYYGEYLASDWKQPEGFGDGEKKEALTVAQAQALVQRGDGNLGAHEVVSNLVRDKTGLTLDMLTGWSMTVHEDNLQIPYPDWLAVKYRDADGNKFFAKGSTPGLYYRTGYQRGPVLMVEGESDTWVATHRVGDTYDVRGISGVSTRPEKVASSLAGRDMVIFFDGDDAGRSASVRWAEWCTSHGGHATIVPTPEGQDISDLSEAEFNFLLTQRRAPVTNTSGLMDFGNGYGFEDKKGEPSYVSNWTLKVSTLLRMDDGTTAYEGTFMLSGKPRDTVILSRHDLSGTASLNKWASRYGGSFYGATSVPARLDNLLASESYMAPILPGTATPGLKGSTFAWPHGYIGNTEVRSFEDPSRPMSMADAYDITEANPRHTLETLLCMHTPEVMIPVLSWLAIAPLRSKYKQFPPLFVHGRAGSGKTTIVDKSLDLFSGVKFSSNLTSTTPYGLTRIMGGSNAFPTWFDEYRPSARKDAIQMMDQMLRDSYNKAVSYRGGLGDNLSSLTATTTDNPLVVSGEDFADETSHRDRLIKVFVPMAGKGILPVSKPLAANYLGFLTSTNQYGLTYVDHPPTIVPSTLKGLTDRQAYNIGVLDAGYELLNQYCIALGVSLPAKDWTSLVGEMEEDSKEDQVLDALRLCYESKWNEDEAVFREGKVTYVHSSSVLSLAERLHINLSVSSAKALTTYLKNNYNGELVTYRDPFKQRRLVKLPFDIEKV